MDRIVSYNFPTFGTLADARKLHKLGHPMSPDPFLERRTAVRYKLRLPVIFHWNDGEEHIDGGFTSDVALNGLFILSNKCPPLGSEIRIEVLLPSPDQTAEAIRIDCVGRVTRVLDKQRPASFGVQGFLDDDRLTLNVLK